MSAELQSLITGLFRLLLRLLLRGLVRGWSTLLSQSTEDAEPVQQHPRRRAESVDLARRLLLHLLLAIICLIGGCNSNENTVVDTEQTTTTVVSGVEALARERDQRLKDAEASRRRGDLTVASQLVNQQLLRTPDDPRTLLLAGRLAADNADLIVAVDLVASIPLDSELFDESTQLLVTWYLELGQYQKAVTRLQAGLSRTGLAPKAKLAFERQLWALLNRLGQRQQASAIAEQLCRSGYFGREVLISLLRRGDAFPLALGNDSPSQHFYPGLGMARWFFSQESSRGVGLPTLSSGWV